MLKTTTGNFDASRFSAIALSAPRQVWLAGLGAAIVTREWATKDAGPMFRSLVKEGESVEGRVRRVIGRQVDNSMALATVAWNTARDTALTTVTTVVAAAAKLPRLHAPARTSTPKSIRRSPVKARKSRKTKRLHKS